MTNEKSVIRFTNQLSSTITLKNTTKELFFDDIISLRTNKLSKKDFIIKYDNLFDGTTANFGQKAFNDKSLSNQQQIDKAISSFLGSVRRNSNINEFQNLSNQDFVKFNQDLRFASQVKGKITTKVQKAKTTTYSRSTIFSKTNKSYKSTIGYIGFAEKEVLGLKQAWQIDFIKKNNLIGRQEVLIRINYDLFTQEKKPQIFSLNNWNTFSSGFSGKELLITLYLDVYRQVKEFIIKCSQSKLNVQLNRVCTYVIRKGGK